MIAVAPGQARGTDGPPARTRVGTQPVANDKSQVSRTPFLNAARRARSPVTIFLVNGVKLQGVVSWFDNFCLLLRRDGASPAGLQARHFHHHAPLSLCSSHEPELEEAEGRLKPRTASTRRRRARAPWSSTPDRGRRRDALRGPQARLDEAAGLARALRPEEIRGTTLTRVRTETPATLFGRGKVAELADLCRDLAVDIVVVDGVADAGAGAQSRTRLAGQGDRSHRSHPGDLRPPGPHARRAACRWSSPASTMNNSRLVGTWTHLERQRSGFGFLGGPGET